MTLPVAKYEGFTMKPFTCDYPALERNKYTLLYKLKIQTKEEAVNVIARMKLKNNPYLTRFLRFKLIERSDGHTIHEREETEGVHFHKHEQVLIVREFNRLVLHAGKIYTVPNVIHSMLTNDS
jgi:hypothetical protein